MASFDERRLFRSLTLPCGVTLKNRIVKSAMSDSLGDGRGGPTDAQRNLYALWANGGAAVSIIGEVQGTADYPEKPGNLVLDDQADPDAFRQLTSAGQTKQALLWAQLGHAGAMADPHISDAKGPSALSLPGLTCAALSLAEIEAYPAQCATTAQRAKDAGFGGVEIHAAHGFLLSQFLSPLFNHRTDAFGGSLENRMRLLLHVVDAVRSAVGPEFPVAIKLNATDQLDGGFGMEEALDVITALDGKDVDVIDISGGTYFPGAPSASDRASAGPYFLDFATNARLRTSIPLMVTGGFKTQQQAAMAIEGGGADLIGLARALIVDPDLPHRWQADPDYDPQFPRFHNPPEGGVTAWYTMQMTQLATGQKDLSPEHLAEAIETYEKRDDDRRATWLQHFRRSNGPR